MLIVKIIFPLPLLMLCVFGCGQGQSQEEAVSPTSSQERESPSSNGQPEPSTASPAGKKEERALWTGMILVGEGKHPDFIHVHTPGLRQPSDAVPQLIGFLEKSKDAGIRGSAVGWLASLGPDAQAAIPALKKALHDDPSPGVRAEAAEALRRIEGRSREQESDKPAPAADIPASSPGSTASPQRASSK